MRRTLQNSDSKKYCIVGIDVSEYCCSLVPDEIVQRFMSTPEGLFPEMEEEQEEDHVPTAKKEQPVVPVAEAYPAA